MSDDEITEFTAAGDAYLTLEWLDGNSYDFPKPDLDRAFRWHQQACDNIDAWGQQDLETLLLATQEELGELTQATLEATHEDGDPETVRSELDDLAALVFQLQWALERGGSDE